MQSHGSGQLASWFKTSICRVMVGAGNGDRKGTGAGTYVRTYGHGHAVSGKAVWANNCKGLQWSLLERRSRESLDVAAGADEGGRAYRNSTSHDHFDKINTCLIIPYAYFLVHFGNTSFTGHDMSGWRQVPRVELVVNNVMQLNSSADS